MMMMKCRAHKNSTADRAHSMYGKSCRAVGYLDAPSSRGLSAAARSTAVMMPNEHAWHDPVGIHGAETGCSQSRRRCRPVVAQMWEAAPLRISKRRRYPASFDGLSPCDGWGARLRVDIADDAAADER
jgi:hypothetical protein